MSNDYWRKIASDRSLNPDEVAPFHTKEDVGIALSKGIITRPQPEKILGQKRFNLK
jgi:hypothetical protein